MFETNTHWHCSADKNNNNNSKHIKTYVSALSAIDLRKLTSHFPWKKRQTIGKTSCHAAGFDSYFTAYFDGGVTHTHMQSEIHTPHNHTHTQTQQAMTEGTSSSCVCKDEPSLPPSPQLEICD